MNGLPCDPLGALRGAYRLPTTVMELGDRGDVGLSRTPHPLPAHERRPLVSGQDQHWTDAVLRVPYSHDARQVGRNLDTSTLVVTAGALVPQGTRQVYVKSHPATPLFRWSGQPCRARRKTEGSRERGIGEASLAVCLQAKLARLDPVGEYLPTRRADDQHWAALVLGVPDGDDAGKILGYLEALAGTAAVAALGPPGT